MKLIKSNFLIFTIALVLFNCSNEKILENVVKALDPSLYYEELDVSYGDDSDQKFDLYLPANRTTDTKMMILVHGGGWTSGDKANMNAIKDLLRQDFPNLAIVNINYRLADENNNPYPMQIDDMRPLKKGYKFWLGLIFNNFR